MKHVFKGFAAAVAMTAAGAIAASSAMADTSWPTKPITMLIGYKAGGGTDTGSGTATTARPVLASAP